MPAYWMARVRVVDPVEYKKYTDRVPAVIEKYGGRPLSYDGEYETLEGPEHFDRFVLIEFDTMEDARRAFDSPEYAEAAEFRRHGAGENELIILGGREDVEAPPR